MYTGLRFGLNNQNGFDTRYDPAPRHAPTWPT
jgi:hypothetical protein